MREQPGATRGEQVCADFLFCCYSDLESLLPAARIRAYPAQLRA